MEVTFTPNAAGNHNATLTFADNAGGGHSVALSGGGYTALAAPTFSISTGTQVLTGTPVIITAPYGASVLYTSDNSNPLTSPTAQLSGSPFTFQINNPITLNAVSRQTGIGDSTVAAATYSTIPGAVSPLSAILTSGQFIPFMMSGSQPDSWSSLNDYIILSITTAYNYGLTPNVCEVEYWPRTSTVLLVLDNGYSFASGAIGSNTVLSNSQCTLNLAESAAVITNTMLTVTVPVAFNASYAGSRSLLMDIVWMGANTWRYLGDDTIQANSVTVTPAAVSLTAGEQQQFTANTAVIWSVSPQVGPISGAGQYSAPSWIASQQVVTVKATSQADATKFATGLVTLLPGGIPADLHLTNLTITSGTATYQATHSITADTNVVVSGSANVTFAAGTIITLDPGFHATAGGSGTTFHAVIQ